MIFGFVLGWADRHYTENYKLNAVATAALGIAFGVLSQVR
jgi:hypothetical protein